MSSAGGVVVITGGAGGIGSAIAEAAAKRGHIPVLLYHRSKDAAHVLERAIGEALAIKCDVSSEEQVRAMVEIVLQKYGRIDALVHCASPKIQYARFEKKTREDFQAHLETSLFGAVNCVRHTLPIMLSQKKGSIVMILTQNVIGRPQPGFSDYVSAKYALLGLMKCLAAEYATKGIRTNAISPGMVETNFLENLPRKAIEMEKESLGGRLTTPEDVASAALSLLEDQAATGKHLVVVGGSVTEHGAD